MIPVIRLVILALSFFSGACIPAIDRQTVHENTIVRFRQEHDNNFANFTIGEWNQFKRKYSK